MLLKLCLSFFQQIKELSAPVQDSLFVNVQHLQEPNDGIKREATILEI